MSEFVIDVARMNPVPEEIKSNIEALKTYISSMSGVKSAIELGSSTAAIRKNIEKAENALQKESDSIKLFAEKLELIIKEYTNAEGKITGKTIKDAKTSKADGAADEKSDEDSFIAEALKQAALGEFYDGEGNWLGDILSLVVSFVPGLNCAADIRDLAADIMAIAKTGEWPTAEQIGLIMLDLVSLGLDVFSLGKVVKGIKGATTATKLSKTAAKDSAKAASQSAKEAAKTAKAAEKTAKEAAKDAAEKNTRKTVRKATKTAASAERAAQAAKDAKAAEKTAKQTAKQASQNHAKKVVKETVKQTAKATKDAAVDEVKDWVEKPEQKMAEEAADDYKDNVREKMKNQKK